MQNQRGTVLAPSSLLGEGSSQPGTSSLLLIAPPSPLFFSLFLNTSVQTLLQRAGVNAAQALARKQPEEGPSV